MPRDKQKTVKKIQNQKLLLLLLKFFHDAIDIRFRNS